MPSWIFQGASLSGDISNAVTMPLSCQTKLLSKHVVCMSQGPGRKTDGLFKRGNWRDFNKGVIYQAVARVQENQRIAQGLKAGHHEKLLSPVSQKKWGKECSWKLERRACQKGERWRNKYFNLLPFTLSAPFGVSHWPHPIWIQRTRDPQ